MNLALHALTVRNFKAVKSLEVALDGRNATISGRNASGKTTVYDAFLWLLFGKDSSGSASFAFKPLDADGNEIHNLETSVEARVTIDGAPHTLRRTSTEKWTKPRGQVDHVFGGDTTAYWIDDVPKTQREFRDYIDALIPEATFRLITNHTAFMAMKPADRRSVLVSIAGGDVDKLLAVQLPEAFAALEGFSPDDAKKRIKERRKRTQADLDGIPPRIDELHRAMDGADALTKTGLELEITALNTEADRLRGLLADDPAAALKRRHADATREADALKAVAEREHKNLLTDAKERVSRASLEVDRTRVSYSKATNDVARSESDVSRLDARVTQLRADYNAAYAMPDTGTCAACNQPLPADQVKAAKAKALAQIKAEGQSAAYALDDARRALTEATERQKDAKTAQETARAELDAAQAALDAIAAEAVTYPPEYHALLVEIAEIAAKLAQPDTHTADLREQLHAVKVTLEAKNAAIGRLDAADAAKKRIDQLTAEQRMHGDTLAALDRQLILIEQYVSARCKLLESSINALFPTIRWRLFVTQDNGGIADACDCMIPADGAFVPYESANTGAKINAGLEIINALCKAYNVAAPVFVDSAESVNRIAATAGQQIRLEVTTGDLTLTKEY